MNITSIHFKIISCLQENVYSIQELSDILGIALSKIRRSINDLEYLLKENGVLNLHEKLRKKEFSNFFIEKLKKQQSFTPEERKIYLILNFFKENSINLLKISDELNVTRRTLSTDLTSLKDVLVKFNLKVESLNYIGVNLLGLEREKRIFFEVYILKIILEKKFLPIQFEVFLKYLNEIAVENFLYERVESFLKKKHIVYHTVTLLHLRILTIICIVRESFMDESLLEKKFKVGSDLKSIDNLYPKYTQFEIERIREFCKTRRKDTLLVENKEKLQKAKDLITYINFNLKLSIEETNEILTQIIYFILMTDFKKSFEIRDFYIYNKDMSKEYFNEFLKIKKLLETFFKGIDSFDSTTLAIIFLNIINKKIEKKIEKIEKIVVVYDILNHFFIIDSLKELGLKKILQKVMFVSVNDLDLFLSYNKIESLITFEDIGLDRKNIKLIKFKLPISKIDKFKLKEILN